MFSHVRPFVVLALESSADDTCAALVSSSASILANVVIKQPLHERFGGIEPLSAIRAHQRNMPFAVQKALADARLDLARDVHGIAVTRGPGMAGCLSVGFNAAKTLAAALSKPLVGVHHMQAHALASSLVADSPPPVFPFLTLLLSGGHTILALVCSLDSFRILATTADESIGRAFDKVSRILDLKWTSLGPGDALEKFCAEDPLAIGPRVPPFPKPLTGVSQFSYSSLHSHVERIIHHLGGIQNVDVAYRRGLARAFQHSAVAQLEEKLMLGLDWCRRRGIVISDVVIGGGVASNMYLRKRLADALRIMDHHAPPVLRFPPGHLCTDNAAMIAWASMHRFIAHDVDDYGIELQPSWSIEGLTNLLDGNKK